MGKPLDGTVAAMQKRHGRHCRHGRERIDCPASRDAATRNRAIRFSSEV